MPNYSDSVYRMAWIELYRAFSERMQQDELDLMNSVLLGVAADYDEHLKATNPLKRMGF